MFFDRTFDKICLKNLVYWTFQRYGPERALEFSECLKNVGFRLATRAGLSLSIEDFLIPKEKRLISNLADTEIRKSKIYEELGAITPLEINQIFTTTWTSASENLKSAILETFRNEDLLNPLYLMAFSGARGNLIQIRQLIGMRGIIVDPLGRLIERPVRSNFKEGIKLTEFLLSCYGARKGIVDTALRTAKAGYLTRRLVDISHFQVISIRDCNTQRGIRIFPLADRKGQILIPLVERRKGRALSNSVSGFGPRNLFLDTSSAKQVRDKYPYVLYRSPLICRTPFLSSLARLSFNSIVDQLCKRDVTFSNSFFYRYDPNRYPTLCQYCYGWSLTEITLVHIGEAVGILAAQSIGEPGTQLTIRTFHTGGVFLSEISETFRRPINGQVFFKTPLKGRLARSTMGRVGFLTREPGLILLKKNRNVWKKLYYSEKDNFYGVNPCQRQIIFFPRGVLLLIRQAQWVSANSILALIGSGEFSYEGDLIVKIHRIPYRREIFFEDVSLKKLFSYAKKREFIEKESSKYISYLISIDRFQRLQTGDFSRFLLKSAEPLEIRQKFTYPFCFPWENGDFVGNYISLIKIEVRKPVACLFYSKEKWRFNWNVTNNSGEFKEFWKNIFQVHRISFYQSRYLLSSIKITYRNFFSSTQIISLNVFYIRFFISHKTVKFLQFYSTYSNIRINFKVFFLRYPFINNFFSINGTQKLNLWYYLDIVKRLSKTVLIPLLKDAFFKNSKTKKNIIFSHLIVPQFCKQKGLFSLFWIRRQKKKIFLG
jgi:hypothetical protein